MIRKIKWNDHAILGNLELDFTKPDGSVYNTIVLAGENGTGKTTILETLSTFLNLGSIEPFEYIKQQNIPCAAAQIAGEAMNVKKPADYSVMYRKLTEILA